MLICGMTLFFFSNGNWIVPICAWLAPPSLLLFLRGQQKIKKLLLLLILFVLATRFMLAEIIPTSIGILYYILTVYYAVMWFFPYWMHSIMASKVEGFRSTLIFPVAGVSAEFLNTIFFGSWGSIAYSQFGNIPFMQTASLIGIWGLTFMILWFGSVIDWCWHEEEMLQRIRRRAWIYPLILVGLLIFGGIRMVTYFPDRNIDPVASFTPASEITAYVNSLELAGYVSTRNMLQNAPDELLKLLDATHDAMFVKMDSIISDRTSFFVWPEAPVNVLPLNEDKFIEKAQIISEENSCYTMLAYYLLTPNGAERKPENKCVLIGPDGEVIFHYLKAYPTPGAAHKAGEKKIPVVDTEYGRVGAAICYDMDFTRLIHQAGRKKVDLMLVPAWDWEAIDPLHTHMAIFRGVENGFSVLRQTGEGLSVCSDPLGRIIAQMDYFTSPDNVMITQVPVQRVPTLYSLIGDSFAWFSMLLLFLFGIGIIRK